MRLAALVAKREIWQCCADLWTNAFNVDLRSGSGGLGLAGVADTDDQ